MSYLSTSARRTGLPAALQSPDALGAEPEPANEKEHAFRDWYAGQVRDNGRDWDPNPDAPEHLYDFRGLHKETLPGGMFADLAERSAGHGGHYPSEFKMSGHPREFLRAPNGRIFNTRELTYVDDGSAIPDDVMNDPTSAEVTPEEVSRAGATPSKGLGSMPSVFQGSDMFGFDPNARPKRSADEAYATPPQQLGGDDGGEAWGLSLGPTKRGAAIAGNATTPMPQPHEDVGSTQAALSASTVPTATSSPSVGQYDPSGAPVPQTGASPAGAGAAAAAGGGAMSWLGPVASAVAARQQEVNARQMAKGDLNAEFAGSTGFPMYGYEGQKRGRQITERNGGLGLGGVGNILRNAHLFGK